MFAPRSYRPCALVLLTTLACTTNLKLADDLSVTCTDTGACPEGRVCAEDIGTCVVPGQACVSANGNRYRSEPDGNQCPIAGGDGICLAGDCVHSTCGDGYADTTRGEVCDSGLGNSDSTSDACRSNCLPARCGDGVIDLGIGEACDDGNTTSGDGCSQTCKKVEVCGDAFVDVGEDCDDGNDNDNDGCNACTTTTWNASILTGLGLGGGNPTQTATLNAAGAAFDGVGGLFLGDRGRLRRLDLASRRLATIAGNGIFPTGTYPDVAVATQIPIYNIANIVLDNHRNVFINDTVNIIRMVDDESVIRRVAGTAGNNCSGTAPACGDNDFAIKAVVSVNGLAVDGLGNLYIADNNRIRKIDRASGNISTIAGNGTLCTGTCSDGDGGAASAAKFLTTSGIAIDSQGATYIADSGGHRIRRMAGTSPTSTITTYAGNGTTCASGTCGEGQAATSTALNFAHNIAFDSADNLYFIDSGASASPAWRVRRIAASDGKITTVAGSTACVLANDPCGDGGPATAARLRTIMGIAVSPEGMIAIADQAHRFRLVDTNGIITTVAGTGGTTDMPIGVAATSAPVRAVTAGFDTAGNILSIDGDSWGVLYRVSPSRPTLVPVLGITQPGVTDPGGDGPADHIDSMIQDVAADSHGNIFFIDENAYLVRRLDAATGTVNTIAGVANSFCATPTGTCNDGANGRAALLTDPNGIFIDTNDQLLIADMSDNKIRKVDLRSCSAANGWQCAITTIAGTGTYGYAGDNVAATTASLACPSDVTAKADGTIYFTDLLNCAVRSITTDGKIHLVKNLAASVNCPVTTPSDGCIIDSVPGGEPALMGITALGTDVFYVDQTRGTVHRIDGSGTDTVVVGNGPNNGDGLPGTQIALEFPARVESRPGQLLIADQSSNFDRLRVADTTTFVLQTVGGIVDGLPTGPLATSAFAGPVAIVPSPSQNGWLVADGSAGRIKRVDTTTDWVDVVLGYPGNLDDNVPRPASTMRLLTQASSIAEDTTNHVLYVLEQESLPAATIHKVTMATATDASTWTATRWLSVSTGTSLDHPGALAFDAAHRRLYVADTGNNMVRALQVDDVSPTLQVVAGQLGHRGFAGEGVPATSAVLDSPGGLAIGPDDTLYIADTSNNRVRWVDAAGLIWTIIGDGVAASSGQGSPASAFPVDTPRGLAFDSFGNLYVSSRTAIRMITAAGAPGESLADRPVKTIYGAYPRTGFPDAITECIVGVSVAQDDASVAAIDQCKGLIVRLTRTAQ